MIRLRPIGPDDEPFLRKVYASTRAAELAQVDWDDAQKDQFVRMQFEAQHTHYMAHFPRADYRVIVKGDAEIGRLYVDRRDDEIRLIDIAILPEFQREGTGGLLLGKLLDEARQRDVPVRIHVEKFNTALRWYQDLGFREIEDQGVYLLMEWSP